MSKSVAGLLLATNMVLAPQFFGTNGTNVNKDGLSAEAPREETRYSEVLPMCADGKQSSPACVKFLILMYAKKNKVDASLALKLADCESNFRPNVFGDSGKAYGIFQFHKKTFDEFSLKMGETLDYYDTEDNVKLAMWALANKKQDHWSCYDKVVSKYRTYANGA